MERLRSPLYCVFSGSASSYDETSLPDPISAYGAAKAAAETAVRSIDPGAVVARTSLIIGDGDSPQECYVAGLAAGTVDGALFTDDVRCPVHVADLASALLELAASAYAGIANVAGGDALSRYELGVLIARRDGFDSAAFPHWYQGEIWHCRADRRAPRLHGNPGQAGHPVPRSPRVPCSILTDTVADLSTESVRTRPPFQPANVTSGNAGTRTVAHLNTVVDGVSDQRCRTERLADLGIVRTANLEPCGPE